MRRTLTVLVAACSSAAVLALVIPLALLVGRLAQDRAVAAATQQAQSVALLIATGTPVDRLADVVALGDQRTGFRTSVVPPTGTPLGPAIESVDLTRARTGEAFTTFPGGAADGAEVFLPVAAGSGTSVVRVGISTADLHQGVAQARILLAALGFGLVLLSLLAAVALARRVSAPLVRVAEVAHDLRGGDLERRVQPDGPAEVREVGTALNALAARIGGLLQAEREAAADLSHRLRTPVTALRLAVDTTTDPEERGRLREHLDRLEATVDVVVRQARVPANHGAQPDVRADLTAIVTERAAFWTALAEDQHRDLRTAISGVDAVVRADPQDLVDVVDVLLDNVFAHTPVGTDLAIAVVADAMSVSLVVSDDGPGLPPAGELARGQSSAGSTGLGLDIVTRVAATSGAELELGASPAGGAQISVRWPRATSLG
jgi:signal transduction histidine kinase